MLTKLVSVKTKSKEFHIWQSATEPYMMSGNKIFEEILQVLDGFVEKNNESPSLITLNAELEHTLVSHSVMYGRISDFNTISRRVLGVPYQFKRKPDYDYIVE